MHIAEGLDRRINVHFYLSLYFPSLSSFLWVIFAELNATVSSDYFKVKIEQYFGEWTTNTPLNIIYILFSIRQNTKNI